MVIDDGSVDNTVNIAKEYGVEHILILGKNFGLGTAFSRGLAYTLSQDADIIVNTDADNQYNSDDI